MDLLHVGSMGVPDGVLDLTVVDSDLPKLYIQLWNISRETGRQTIHQSRCIRRQIIELESAEDLRRDDSTTSSSSLDAIDLSSPSSSAKACESCGLELKRDPHLSILICPSCGVFQKWYDNSYNAVDYNEDIEFTSFSYRRQNHFNEWLNVSQAKESTDIPKAVLQQIMRILFQMGKRTPETLTKLDIRRALKTLKLRRYYENSTAILCLLNGIPPPRFTPNQESLLKTMFKKIQQPFELTCPKDRSNFFSYSYIMYKFTELLGLPHKKHFSLLKVRNTA